VFSNVGGVLNAISWKAGRSVHALSGRGAGEPTAVSVVADVIDVGRAIVGAARLRERRTPAHGSALLDANELSLRYYLRLSVADEPGVMAHVAVAAEGVSLSQVMQSESDGRAAQTSSSPAREGSVKSALTRSAPHAPGSCAGPAAHRGDMSAQEDAPLGVFDSAWAG
jgi:homoserine dehydrogenase